jgi:hypothetical protein
VLGEAGSSPQLPEDLAIVAYDDIEFAAAAAVSLIGAATAAAARPPRRGSPPGR